MGEGREEGWGRDIGVGEGCEEEGWGRMGKRIERGGRWRYVQQ